MDADLTSGDVARIAGVSVNTVLKWCDRGMLPHYRFMNHRRFSARSVRAFMDHYGVPVQAAMVHERKRRKDAKTCK